MFGRRHIRYRMISIIIPPLNAALNILRNLVTGQYRQRTIMVYLSKGTLMEPIISKLKESGLIPGLHTPEQVAIVLRKFAEWFPFENLDVMCGYSHDITPQFLKTKLFQTRRGGLCYEINPLLFQTLKELGFDVQLGSATVNNNGKWALKNTHVMVLLMIDGRRFIADGGFGNKLALYPLEIEGKPVASPAGTFRVKRMKTDRGSYALQSQTENGGWVLHYAFDWQPIEWKALNEIREKIHHHPRSPFNKQLLIASITEDGTCSINEERMLCAFSDGIKKISRFAEKTDMLRYVRALYSSAIAKEAEKYLYTH